MEEALASPGRQPTMTRTECWWSRLVLQPPGNTPCMDALLPDQVGRNGQLERLDMVPDREPVAAVVGDI